MLAALLTLFLACAPKAPQAPAALAEAAPDGAIAPQPFTAQQLREAMPVGTTMVMRVEEQGQPAQLSRWTVTAADAQKATFSFQALGDDGAPTGQPETSQDTWEALNAHSAFPAAATERTEGELDTPMGRLKTISYAVTKAEDALSVVETYVFAVDKPGPPVLMKVEVAGTAVLTMTMMEHTRP